MEQPDLPEGVGPAGVAIVVAFSGAVVASGGALLRILAPTVEAVASIGLVLVVIGLVVVALSPLAWLRARRLVDPE